MEAGTYAQDFNAKLSDKKEQEVLSELKADGVNIVEVTDKSEWVEACKDIIQSSTADQAELYKKIVDMK